MKKDDWSLIQKDVYSSSVSAQKKEQNDVWGELTSMKKKKYTHTHVFKCAHVHKYLFTHEQTSVEYYF